MSDTLTTHSDVVPSAAPSEAEIAAWQELPRDERLHRLQLSLRDPDCDIATTTTVAEILANVLKGTAAPQHGTMTP